MLTGLPIARIALGDAAVPIVALLLGFNALTLCTLVSISVEWSLHGSCRARAIATTALRVLRNPIILAIVGGAAFGCAGLRLPSLADTALEAVSHFAGPAALFALGLELAAFLIRRAWAASLKLCAVKLIVQPLVVWLLAVLLGLPALERQVVILVAGMADGVNAYLKVLRFQTLQGTIATCIVLSNVLAAATTPLLLAVLQSVS